MEIVVPTVSATFKHDGRVHRFIRGRTTIEAGHPILKGREHLVRPLTVDYPAPAAKEPPAGKTDKPAKAETSPAETTS